MHASANHSILDVPQGHAARWPDRVAFRYLEAGDCETMQLTYGAPLPAHS